MALRFPGAPREVLKSPSTLLTLTVLQVCRMYALRVANSEGGSGIMQGSLLFSLPANCMLASLKARHRLDINAGPRQELVGMQWRFSKALDCAAWQGVQAWPQQTDVKILLPVDGIDLSNVYATLPQGAQAAI